MLLMPRAVCLVVDALEEGIPLEPEDLAACNRELDTLKAWLTEQGEFWLDDVEQVDFPNLLVILDEVQNAQSAEGFTQKTVELFDRARTLRLRRERKGVSSQPAVNEFLQAGWAFLRKQAPPAAVQRRMPAVRVYLDEAAGKLKEFGPRLPPEVRQALEVGYRLADEAYNALLKPSKNLEGLLAELKEGVSLLQHLHAHERKLEEQVLGRYQAYAFPNGSEWEMALESGPNAYRYLRQDALPRTQAEWENLRAELVLPPELGVELPYRVDMLLDQIGQALRAGQDPRQLLQELSATYRTILRSRLKNPEPMTVIGQLWDLSAAALAGRIPRAYLRRILEAEERLDPAWEEYLATGQESDLLAGLGELHGRLKPASEAATNWLCPACERENFWAAPRCVGCASLKP